MKFFANLICRLADGEGVISKSEYDTLKAKAELIDGLIRDMKAIDRSQSDAGLISDSISIYRELYRKAKAIK